MLNFLVLILGAFAAVNIWDVNDRFFILIEHLWQVIEVTSRIEVVPNIQLLQMLVTAKLFIVGVSHRHEPPLILRHQHGSSVATKITACHSDQVRLIAFNQLSHEFA